MWTSQEFMDLTVLLDTHYGENFLRIVSKQEFAKMGYHATTLLKVQIEATPDAPAEALREALATAGGAR